MATETLTTEELFGSAPQKTFSTEEIFGSKGQGVGEVSFSTEELDALGKDKADPFFVLPFETFRKKKLSESDRPLTEKAGAFLGAAKEAAGGVLDIGKQAVEGVAGEIGKFTVASPKERARFLLSPTGFSIPRDEPFNPDTDLASPSQTIKSGAAKSLLYLGDIIQRTGVGAFQKGQELASGANQEEVIKNDYDRYKINKSVQQTIEGTNIANPEAQRGAAEAIGIALGPEAIATKGLLSRAARAEQVGAKAAETALKQRPLPPNMVSLRSPPIPKPAPTGGVRGFIGRGLETTGQKIKSAAETPANIAGSAVERITGRADLGEKVRKFVNAGSTTVGLGTSLTSLSIPGIGPVAALITGGRAIGFGIEKVGSIVRALGEKASKGAERRSVFFRIAADPSYAPWLRNSARLAEAGRLLDENIFGVGKGIDMAKTTLQTGLQGAKAGTGLALLSVPQDAEEAGNFAGMGFGVGLFFAPSVVRSKSIIQQRQIVEGMRAKAVDSMIRQNVSPELIKSLSPETAYKMGVLQDAFTGVDFRYVSANEYAALSKNRGGAAFYRVNEKGQPEFVVNTEAKHFESNVYHEIGEALYDSPVTNRSDIQLTLENLYSEAQINNFKVEYAKALAEDKISKRERFGRKATNEEVNQQVRELDIVDPQWIYRELFSEHFLSEVTISNVGKILEGQRVQQQSPVGQGKALNFMATMLNQLGIKFDPKGSGKPMVIDTTLFKGLRHDAELRNLVRSYLIARDKWIQGVSRETIKEGEVQGKVALDPQLIGKHPSAPLHTNPRTGLKENDFAVQMPDGSVIVRTRREFNQIEKNRAEEVQSNLDLLEELPREDPRLGIKTIAGGGKRISGSIMPEWFFRLESFSPETKEMVRSLQESMGSGQSFNMWYQAIGTGRGAFRAKVIKKLAGNLMPSNRDFKPISFWVSRVGDVNMQGRIIKKGGNVLVIGMDVTATQRRALKWHSEGRMDTLWSGNLNDFWKDTFTLLKNHQEGKPGSDSIGQAKRDFLYEFFGIQNKDVGDLASTRLFPAEKDSLIKAFRVDRIQSPKKTQADQWFFDYNKHLNKLRPEGEPAQPSTTEPTPPPLSPP